VNYFVIQRVASNGYTLDIGTDNGPCLVPIDRTISPGSRAWTGAAIPDTELDAGGF